MPYVEDEKSIAVLCFGSYTDGEPTGGGVRDGGGIHGCVDAKDCARGGGVG